MKPQDRSGALPPEVRVALQRGDKIGAVRLLRAATGLSLQAAKQRIDAEPRGSATPRAPHAATADVLPADVQAALASGRRIEAIRLLRERRGVDLRTAKLTIDAASRRYGRHRDASARGAGWLPWLLAAAAVAAYVVFTRLL